MLLPLFYAALSERGMPMSLKEIARLVGVSPSTVSRVLNNSSSNCASEELRRRIWAAANSLEYRPNPAARQLRKGGAAAPRSLQLVVVAARFATPEADPFFAQLFRSVEEELFASGALLHGVISSAELQQQGPPEADGYLLLGRCPSEALKSLCRHTENIVGIGRNSTDFRIDEIICSGQQAALLAMEHLLSLGHRRIAYIGGCSYEERFIGYYEALRHHSLPLDQHLVQDTDQTGSSGRAAMARLLEQGGFTAALCANDATALGALEALAEAGRADVDVIGIDNIAAAERVTPALSSVHIPKEEMGRAAVKLLLDRIRGGHREHVRMEFPCRLVLRASCKGPHSGK
ncbi:MAG: LacI family DNA-binding transcriptional regulator [Bacillota bacterium]|nr:LacI family DNA-binding transcriptional regulator [Bacillota bacterium]